MSKVIGTFTLQNEQYVGIIRTLHLNVSVRIVPTKAEEDKAPNYRILVDEYELGAGWSRTSEQGNAYLNVRLDDPSLPAPLNARLVAKKDSNEFLLIWSRS